MKISVIGSGSWGSALANVASDNGHEVVIYGINEEEIRDINENHANSKYFEQVLMNETISATLDLKEAVYHAQVIVLAVPTVAIQSLCSQMVPFLMNQPIFVNVAKGFDPITNERMSSTIRQTIPAHLRQEVVSLIGPSHAEEVILKLYTAICSVCVHHDTAKIIQEVFSNNYLRVYTLEDEIGAEYGAASKNAIALASGIIAGLGYGDNTRAALMTRGLAEMVRLGTKKGGQLTTYLGLTGMGDLIVTCSSLHSRNFQAGFAIGKKDDAEEFLKNNSKTVEGIRTCKVLHEESQKLGIELPINEAVYQVLYQLKKPSEIIEKLMGRELKEEKY